MNTRALRIIILPGFYFLERCQFLRVSRPIRGLRRSTYSPIILSAPTPVNLAGMNADAILLDDRNLAMLLAVSRSHIHRMRAAGRLPEPLKLGRAARWLRTEIEAWLGAGAPTLELWRARKQMEQRRSARGMIG